METAVHLPKLVGTLTALDTLRDYAARAPEERLADLVEIRLDQFPVAAHAECFRLARQLERTGTPVVATLRTVAQWKKGDAARLATFKLALAAVSYVDIEHDSAIADKVLALARRAGKKAIASLHNYDETPGLAVLQKDVAAAFRRGAPVVKIATQVNRLDDHGTLTALLHAHRGRELCVLGMGALGLSLRVYLPAAGSCLAYAYLDRPMAPGQLSCGIMCSLLRKTCPAYNEHFTLRTLAPEGA